MGSRPRVTNQQHQIDLIFDLVKISTRFYESKYEPSNEYRPTIANENINQMTFRDIVTSSSWSNDLRDQVEHTRVLSVVYQSATAIGSRLSSIANSKAKVAGRLCGLSLAAVM
ncbi:hypothetical protein YC2023_106883 [Brassica napus]